MMRKGILYSLLIGGAVLTTYPFVWMAATSLEDLRAAARPVMRVLPSQWLWENYIETFRAAPFGTYFFNSFFVAFAVTGAVVVSSIAAGYAFASLRFPGRGVLFAVVLTTMMIPLEVTLIPNFIFISRLGWYNTYAALIVPWSANAFSIFLMRQAFLTLPPALFDAARMDGCGHLRFLFRIAVPLVKPMAVTVGLFAFLGSYNALIWPLVVTGTQSMRVVQVGLTVFSGTEGVRIHLLMCASVIVIVPTVAIYFSAQRYFLESYLSAGIKA